MDTSTVLPGTEMILNDVHDRIQKALRTIDADKYKISDFEETISIGYYGFLKADGNWYIMKWNTVVNSFRFAKGESNYPTNWTNRATLTYKYYDEVF